MQVETMKHNIMCAIEEGTDILKDTYENYTSIQKRRVNESVQLLLQALRILGGED